jgi:hypothetical protein
MRRERLYIEKRLTCGAALLFVLLLISNDGASQTYFDIPVQLDFYHTNSDELNYSRRGVIFNPSIGMVLAGNDSSRFEGHFALGIFISKFDQTVGSEKFEFQSIGLLQTSFTGYYNISNKVQAGVGLHFGWYGVSQKKLNLDIDSDYEDRLGKGYNNINFGNSIDFRYNLSGLFSVGAKYTYYYLPQLEYTRIGDYGDFLETQKDLFLTRVELSVRIYTKARSYNRP